MENNQGQQQSKAIELNLKKLFPVSALTDFRRTFWLLTASIMMSLLAALMNVLPASFLPDQNMNHVLTNGVRYLAFALSGWWFAKFVYEALRRHCLYYGIYDGHLLITQGILLKQRGFFPLSRITDIYLERTPIDLLFGLHTLHISTPTSLSERFARIEGLNLSTALALQQLLSSVLEHAEERAVKHSTLHEKERFMPPTPSFAAAATW
ncbi:MAG: PH domain-containing protein [Deltaproteobacteria bacterium]|nr:PH domain-containing protein [Deltaproteobacteria bacterium]